MDFFCTAAAVVAVTEILTVSFVKIEFREQKKLILKFSFRPNIIKVPVIIVGRREPINLKDIWPSSSGLPWSANFKMVWYVLLRSLRLELDGQMSFKEPGN
jgi:hypothetical protein